MTHQDQHDVDPHDQAIEDVLHALRTTNPPQGYESRIHNALLQAQHRNAAREDRHPQRDAAKPKDLLASLLPWMSWATACAAVLILGIAVRSRLHLHPATTQQSNTQRMTRSNELSTQQAPVSTTETTLRVPTKRTPQPRFERANLHDETPRTQRIEVALQTHEYIPEPPLPLTQQERLVLRMARRNDAQQLAEYTPDARARHLHEDAQAYNDYFAAKPLDGQPIYHQKISGETQ